MYAEKVFSIFEISATEFYGRIAIVSWFHKRPFVFFVYFSPDRENISSIYFFKASDFLEIIKANDFCLNRGHEHWQMRLLLLCP